MATDRSLRAGHRSKLPGPLMRAVAVTAGGVLAGAMVVRAGGLIAMLTMSILGIGSLLLVLRMCGGEDDSEERARLVRWTMVAFGAHLAFGYVLSSTNASVEFFGGDALTYHGAASQIVEHWNGDAFMPRLAGGKEGYYYLLAGIYWVFGPYQAAGLALNAALAAGLIPVVGDTTRRLFGEGPVRFVAPLLLLLPGLFVWTSQLLKEAPVLFFIAVAANCVVRMTERVTLARVVTFAMMAAFLLAFRGHVGSFIAAGLLGGVVVGRRQLTSGIAIGVLVFGAMVIVVLAAGVGESGFETVSEANLEQANNTRQGLALGTGSGFGQDVDISTSRRAISYLPLGVVSFMLGPFPWQSGGLRQLAAIPDVLVWWWLLPRLWTGYRQSGRLIGRRTLVLVLPVLLSLVVLALVISNYGTVVREREQIVVLVVPLIALGLHARAVSLASPPAPALTVRP